MTCKQRFLSPQSDGDLDCAISACRNLPPLVRRRFSLRLVSRLRVLVGHAKSSIYLELMTVIYFSESETRVIESASAFNAEREGSPVSSSASETASEVLSSATPLCAPKELKLDEPSHTGLSVRAVVENRYMGGETRDEEMAGCDKRLSHNPDLRRIVDSKIFVYTSRYKRKNPILFFLESGLSFCNPL